MRKPGPRKPKRRRQKPGDCVRRTEENASGRDGRSSRLISWRVGIGGMGTCSLISSMPHLVNRGYGFLRRLGSSVVRNLVPDLVLGAGPDPALGRTHTLMAADWPRVTEPLGVFSCMVLS